jgi:hypothetical protein
MFNIKLIANDDIVSEYLTKLWDDDSTYVLPVSEDLIIKNNDVCNNDELIIFNDLLNLNETNEADFKDRIKKNLKALRDIGFRQYYHLKLEEKILRLKTEGSDEENVNIITKNITDKNIDDVYKYKIANTLKRKDLMKNISICRIFAKYKSGDASQPNNFRYFVNHHNVIKIIDRLWCIELINKCGKNLPDPKIFKSNLIKQFSPSVIKTAASNTNNFDNVILLDIQKAFDSVNWTVLEYLLMSNLTRKINKTEATKLVEQYMVVMKNRNFLYNNRKIKVKKGLATGLPSSATIFTLIMDEIITQWFAKTNYRNNEDFIINIYVDDIYIKFLKYDRISEIINSLINFIEQYQLLINKQKSKVDPKLYLPDFPNKLSCNDFYLGIPFTRDIKLYGQIILKEFQTKHINNLTWQDIYNKIIMNDPSKKSIIGYLNYKLKPIINCEQTNTQIILDFIKDNFIDDFNYYQVILSILLLMVYCIVWFNFIEERHQYITYNYMAI